MVAQNNFFPQNLQNFTSRLSRDKSILNDSGAYIMIYITKKMLEFVSLHLKLIN